MQPTILAAFLEISRTAVSMCSAGIVLLAVALWAAKTDVARSGGLDKIVALGNLCFAVPLAVFGAEHLSGAKFIMLGVPSYGPWRLFWAYFVGFALLSASLSIAAKIWVRSSGLLFGVMMFLFVAMVHIPRVLANPRDRFGWVIVFREMSFAAGGWILAANSILGQSKSKLITVSGVLIAIASIFFGIEHFLHPAGALGVPLEKLTPVWIDAPQCGVREVLEDELRLFPGSIVFGFNDEGAEVFLEALRETGGEHGKEGIRYCAGLQC